MKTVINIALPRGFLGGRPAVATTRTADEQKRDPDGKFGSGGGGGHVQKHVPREDGSRAERADIARASGSHGTSKEKFSREDHKSTAEYHRQQTAKHTVAAKSASGEKKKWHEAAANHHANAAVAHGIAGRKMTAKTAAAAHAATKAANTHMDKK